MHVSRVILQPEWLVDGTGAAPRENVAVAISDGKIESVAPANGIDSSQDDLTFRLPGATLLPGLINNHVHLVLPGDNTPSVPWVDTQSDVELAMLAAHNAEKSLRAGVTTVRDCGGRDAIVLHVRNAQAQGQITGSRIISCGWPLTITGGHGRQFGGEVDGVEAVQQMVRKAIGMGADYIKVMASGGGTPGSLAQFPSYTVPELRAIVEQAHSLGRLVAAHANPPQSLANCIEAGIDLIEHAAYFGADYDLSRDYAIAERLGGAGIPVTATLGVSRDLIDLLPDGPLRSHRLKYGAAQRQNMRNLQDLGVPVLAGNDAGWLATGFDTYWKELHELVLAGFTPVEAIHASTGAVATALRRADEFGTIAPGLAADLLLVDGDAGSDITCLSQVRAVFQSGNLVHSSRDDSMQSRLIA
jgi:imidazolonepropionase-like amidohydrolase